MINLENISFDHCIKCTVCTIYCPVAKATHLFPGPKQSGPDSERLRIKNPDLVDASLKYCTNCKRCESVCPSDVKIADIIQTAKYTFVKKKFMMKVRDYALSRMDLLGKISTFMSSIVNLVMRITIIRAFLDLILGISYKRSFPKFESGSFRKWFKKQRFSQKKFDSEVIFFHGCSVNNMDHALGKDLIKVLNSLNIGIYIPKQTCCGVPAIANSDIKRAKRNARINIKSLKKAVGGTDKKIIFTCSSGAYALKYEYSNFLEMDNSSIYNNIEYITYFLSKLIDSGRSLNLKPLRIRVAYHSPCHLERMGGVIYTIDILKKIPGLDLIILNSECCGLSGTYGFKTEYYNISETIGSQLFDKINESNPEFVITDCVTCKWQIENFTKYKVLHPVTLLAMALEKEG